MRRLLICLILAPLALSAAGCTFYTTPWHLRDEPPMPCGDATMPQCVKPPGATPPAPAPTR